MVSLKSRRSSQSDMTLAGKIGMSLFSLVFLGMGLFFLWFMALQAYETIRARTWQQTACVITESEVTTVSDGYDFRVSYTYQWQERTFASDRYTSASDNATRKDINDADALKRRYPVGSQQVCYVNPDDPRQAVLAHDSPVMLAFVLLPLVFVLVGGGLLYKTWMSGASAQRSLRQAKTARVKGSGQWITAIFFSIFFFAGLGVGVFWIFPAVYKSMNADRWIETPCEILSSRVQRHSDSDGTTYSIDISYTYAFDGENYRSSRYGFIGGSSSGYQGKAEVVRHYPPGAVAVCYVNPEAPSEAVLTTELGLGALLILLPLVFMAVGLGGIVYTFRKMGGRATGREAESPLRPAAPRDYQGRRIGEMVLKPKSSRTGKIAASLFGALFWNGILSLFVYHAYQGWQAGSPDYSLMLFLTPFLLVGLFLIGLVFYYGMAAFNPMPTLTLLTDGVRLGQTVKLRWRIAGNVFKLQQFTLTLTGEEVATYRRGTKTYTDTNLFFSTRLMDEQDPRRMRLGELSFTLPRDSMHSFKSDHNAVVWKLNLRGDIPRWPDIDDAFPIEVGPLMPEEAPQ